VSRIEQALAKAARERKQTSAPEQLQPAFSVLSPDSLTGLDSRLIAFFSGNSLAAEQYRQLRTKVLRAKKLYSHNSFLISSALPGEGKTVTALSLAITIAQGLHDTVLVVDSDLRKPAIHRMLGINREKGLSDYLMGKAKLEEVLVKTKINKLRAIPAGTIPPNPSELISSEEMGKLITELKTRYQNRIIIFDSPPIISLTDSVILSQKVDEVVLVVYANHTPKEAVADAIASLGEANIMGIALNHFDSASHYYRRYRYKYSYKYKYGWL
jgi:non-specific protein-tyrosine kinase